MNFENENTPITEHSPGQSMEIINPEPFALHGKNMSFILGIAPESIPDMPDSMDYNGISVEKKERNHLTIISPQLGKIIKQKAEENPEVINKINTLIQSFKWDIHLRNERYFLQETAYISNPLSKKMKRQIDSDESTEKVLQELQKNQGEHISIDTDSGTWCKAEDRASIIQKVDVPAIDNLYEGLNDMGITVETPPPHITLYTAGNPNGIGVPTYERLVKIGEEI